MGSDFGNPLRKFKLVFLGEQSGESLGLPRLGLDEPINLCMKYISMLLSLLCIRLFVVLFQTMLSLH